MCPSSIGNGSGDSIFHKTFSINLSVLQENSIQFKYPFLFSVSEIHNKFLSLSSVRIYSLKARNTLGKILPLTSLGASW